jgi:hypothetical protein
MGLVQRADAEQVITEQAEPIKVFPGDLVHYIGNQLALVVSVQQKRVMNAFEKGARTYVWVRMVQSDGNIVDDWQDFMSRV